MMCSKAASWCQFLGPKLDKGRNFVSKGKERRKISVVFQSCHIESKADMLECKS